MAQKKDRMVPVREVGKRDDKPRYSVPFTLLVGYAAKVQDKFGTDIEYFDQASRRWRRVEVPDG